VGGEQIAAQLAIIGLGAFGGAALLAAARAGVKAIGFDQFAPPHDRGSTHGETRIVRAAIGEGEAYTPFARRSFELWDQMAEETQMPLVNRCGCLVLGGTLPHATHVPAGFLETTIQAARAHAIPHEILTGAEIRRRFPAFAAYEGAKAFFEPGAGMAYPEAVVAAQITRARALGADIRLDEPVIAIEPDGQGVAIHTRTGVIRADRAILAAGAWTKDFLPPDLARKLTVTRQTLHWFETPAPARDYDPDNMPVFIWNDLYGFPRASAAAEIKIATEALDALADPAHIPLFYPQDRAAIRTRVAKHFPDLGQLRRSAACLYTSTPDFNFWIAQHRDVPALTVISACSGHGFKHAAAVGEAVAMHALERKGTAIPSAWLTLRQPKE
jgi:sarcosine oxidase